MHHFYPNFLSITAAPSPSLAPSIPSVHLPPCCLHQRVVIVRGWRNDGHDDHDDGSDDNLMTRDMTIIDPTHAAPPRDTWHPQWSLIVITREKSGRESSFVFNTQYGHTTELKTWLKAVMVTLAACFKYVAMHCFRSNLTSDCLYLLCVFPSGVLWAGWTF